MATTLQLAQGDYTINLMGSTYQALVNGSQISQPEADILVHVPDVGQSKFVRKRDNNRVAVFPLLIQGTSNDDVLDKITALRRLLNEAFRYETQGDNTAVYLNVTRDTANNTRHLVRGGHLNDAAAHYNAPALADYTARYVQLTLYLSPYGERLTAFSYKNALTTDPGCLNFTAGLSWGLTAIGTVTTSQATSQYLSGGSAQKVVAAHSAAEDRGVRTASATASASSNGCGFVWLNAATGTQDIISVILTDGSNVACTGSYTVDFDPANPAGYDYTYTQPSGSVWYRYSVSGVNTNANFRLRVVRKLANSTVETTWRMDNFYIETGTLNTPSRGWASSMSIDNRGDITSSNPQRLNYIDVWGIPGDAPAILDATIDFTTTPGSENTLYCGSVKDGILFSADEITWIEDNDFTPSISGGSWTQPADATRTAGQYRQATDGGGANTIATLSLTPASGDYSRSLFRQPKRLLLICNFSNVSADVHFYVTKVGAVEIYTGPTITPSRTGWCVLDLGLLNIGGAISLDPINSAYPDQWKLLIKSNLNAAGMNVKIDALALIPAESNFLVCLADSAFATGSNDLYIRGTYKTIEDTISGYAYPALGECYELEPGYLSQRIVFLFAASLSGMEPTLDADLTLSIRPRFSHLLGTL